MFPLTKQSLPALTRHFSTAVSSSTTQMRQVRKLSRRDPKQIDDPNFLPNLDIAVDKVERGHAIADKLIIRRPDMAPPKFDRWQKPITAPLFSVGHPGGIREYVFDREKQGNPLDIQAVRWLDSRVWMAWRMSEITTVILRGTGESVFSRGMSLIFPLEEGRGTKGVPNPLAVTLLQELYQLVYLCSRTPKLLGILNGRASGNSTALIQHSPYRFATPSSEFSLPQTAQGFFPDAGLTHFLSRLENKVGFYLALTGHMLSGTDLMHAGITNYYMGKDGKRDILEFMECNDGYQGSMHEYVNMVNDCSWEDESYSLAPHLESMERCFSQPTIEAILDKLQLEDTSWADQTIETLLKKCPLSLKVTLQALRDGPTLPLEDALKNDFRAARALLSSPEFLNGAKAYAARDKSFKWPRTLRDVRETDVRALFDLDVKLPDLKLPFEDYHDPYEIDWSLEARKRYKRSQAEKGEIPHMPHILDDIERS